MGKTLTNLDAEDKFIIAKALTLYGELVEKLTEDYDLSYKISRLLDYLKYKKD